MKEDKKEMGGFQMVTRGVIEMSAREPSNDDWAGESRHADPIQADRPCFRFPGRVSTGFMRSKKQLEYPRLGNRSPRS